MEHSDTPHNISHLVADAVHDLNNPITAIQLRLNLLKKSPQESERHIKIIEYQVDRLAALVNDLSMVSRLDIGNITTELRLLNLGHVTRHVAESYMPIAQQKDQTITVHAENELPPILADERQIERAIDNLIANAIQYTLNGGRIMLTVSQEPGYVVLEVDDNGIGIDKEDLPHIFNRFYRAPDVQVNYAGTGLGLAIVTGVMERYGGKISVDSVKGHGSSFTLRLPIWSEGKSG